MDEAHNSDWVLAFFDADNDRTIVPEVPYFMSMLLHAEILILSSESNSRLL